MDKKERQRALPGERNWEGKRQKVLIRYADLPCRVTFKTLGEILEEDPRSLYNRWVFRGRPERVKNAAFFKRRPARVPSTKMIRQREAALEKANQKKKELQQKKDSEKLNVRTWGHEGSNAEWRALSDKPRHYKMENRP